MFDEPQLMPEPLMSYLKALGLFRLVAEQADPKAMLAWRGSVAHLNSKFDREGLIEFFLAHYRPTRFSLPGTAAAASMEEVRTRWMRFATLQLSASSPTASQSRRFIHPARN